MARKMASSCIAAILIVPSVGALGQVASPAASDASDSGTADALQEVVVTARRRDENLQNVPVAVTAFSADSLASYNITSIENLGGLTPSLGFSSSTYGALGASVGIRGQRPNDLDLSRTPSVGAEGWRIVRRDYRTDIQDGPLEILYGSGSAEMWKDGDARRLDR